jgi:allophanate hydrolase
MHTESTLLTISDWRQAYREGARPSELLKARAERVAAACPASVWITRVSSEAVATYALVLDAQLEACADDAARKALFARMPLFGVPFAVKDNIDVQGLPTTAACPDHRVMPQESATVVRRLLDAGAVLLGKTNLDQFATGLVGTRSPHGAPASVWDVQRISGGSSSGSAVAVARGDVGFSLGTDTAGSGRVPAGFNQIVGLKPTPGRVSTAGVLPACRTLDCVSIFALTADDAANVLCAMEGSDERDDFSHFVAGPSRLQARRGARPGAPIRIGVPSTPKVRAQDGYDAAWRQACELALACGSELVELDFSVLHEVAHLLYEGPWVAERYAVLEPLLRDRPEAVDPTVATVVRKAEGQRAVDAFKAQYRLQAMRRPAQAMFDGVDVLMVPTTPRHPRFEEVAADPVGVNSELGTYTNFVNLLGWCALALPATTTAAGLPFGVTFIAPAQADAALASWGACWQVACALPMGASGQLPPSQAEQPTADRPATQATLPIAVVGAHLSDLPLNGQLLERGATLQCRARTAPRYRLHALPGTTPPKPGLQRVPEGGASIELEVWDMPMNEVGSFLALIPSPLGLGSIELDDGRSVHGFLCEAHALRDAPDVSAHGGWRAYMAARMAATAASATPTVPAAAS